MTAAQIHAADGVRHLGFAEDLARGLELLEASLAPA
jgi:hypothetical protein